MDSMDLEREKGITILAKNTEVSYGGVKHQHRRHARPRGLRRRGRAWPDHGRRRPAARRRQRGPPAPDPLRPAQGAGGEAAGDPGHQQGRPARRAHQGGRGRGLRAVPGPRRRREPDRVPHPVRERARRVGVDRSRGPDLGPEGAVRDARRPHPAAVPRPGPSAAGPGHEPRRVAVRGPPRALPGDARDHQAGPAGRMVPRRRDHRAGEDHRAVRDGGAGPGRRRRGRARRDHGRGRPGRGHDRGDARRSGRPASASRQPLRRPQPVDDPRHEHLAPRRHGGQQGHRPPGRRPGSTRRSSATCRSSVLPTERPDAGRSRGAESFSWRSWWR